MTFAGRSPHSDSPCIIFDGRYIHDRYHGIGRYAFHLLREIVDILPARRFHVLRDPTLDDSRFDWGPVERARNVSIAEVAGHPFSVQEQWVLPRHLLADRQQVYHTPYFALPWLLPTRALVTVHDCIFERDARYMPRRWARSYYTLLMRASLSRARAIFVPSKATAKDVRHFYRVPARKLIVTPEAADAHFRPLDDSVTLDRVRRRFSLPEQFVLAVGARRPHKNFPLLVQAAGRLEGATLVFVGDVDERFPDETAEAARGMENRVRFLGKVSEEELPVLYNLASVVASPSLVEGFGLPVLEAMACGTPVICSDIPVFKEVAGQAALMLEAKDSAAWAAGMARLLSDGALRESLSRAGRERAALFSWRRAAEAVVPVYARL